MPEAFYLPDGDRFISTDWTRGPWTPEAQHAGPPSALIGRIIEQLDPGPEVMRVARFTAEVLRPVPVSALHVDARVVRPGRRVQYVEASLADDEGEVIRASAWRIRAQDGAVPATELEPPPFPSPDEAGEPDLPPMYEGPSYFTAMQWRFAGGAFLAPGPAAAWMRMGIPLVAGEEPSPLTRVLVVADSGNGISMVLPLGEYLFINVDLSVNLFRMPEGEWVCLDAETRIDRHGIVLAESLLWDERGRLGRGNQSLLVAPR